MDALFLESEMIKRYMPKWNILLRDDKSVSYVRIDMKSSIPYVSITRNPLDDKATYIGPFYGKNIVHKALRVLRKVFPYYEKPYDGKKSLNTDLGLTPGIEIAKTTPAEYKKNLRKLIRYLEGDRVKLIRDLDRQMRQAAEVGDYETARQLRDQYFGLKELKKKIIFSDREFLDLSNDYALVELQTLLALPEIPRRIEGYDISHQSGTDAVASMVVFTNGVSDRTKYRKFKIRQSKNDDTANLREVLSRRLKHTEWDYPDLVILDGSKGQISAVQDLLVAKNIPVIGRDKSGDHSRNASVKIVIPAPSAPPAPSVPATTPVAPAPPSTLTASAPTPSAPPGFGIVPLSANSHLAKLIARIDDESHRFAITYHHLLKRKSMLK